MNNPIINKDMKTIEKEEKMLLCFNCISIQNLHERVMNGKFTSGMQECCQIE